MPAPQRARQSLSPDRLRLRRVDVVVLVLAVPAAGLVLLGDPAAWLVALLAVLASVGLGVLLSRQQRLDEGGVAGGTIAGFILVATLVAGRGHHTTWGLCLVALAAVGVLLGRPALVAALPWALAGTWATSDVTGAVLGRAILLAPSFALGWAGARDTASRRIGALDQALRRRGLAEAVDSTQDQQHVLRRGLQTTVDLVHEALHARHSVLLVFDSSLHVADPIAWQPAEDTPVRADERAGLLAALRAADGPVLADRLADPATSLPWLANAPAVAHALGVTLRDEGVLLGALVVIRTADDAPFTDADASVLDLAAAQAAVVVQNERWVREAGRARQEARHFLGAASALTQALAVDEVCGTLHRLASDVADVEIFAIALRQDEGFQVLYAAGPGMNGLTGTTFDGNAGLVGTAFRRMHVLPYGGTIDDPHEALLGPETAVEGLRAAAALPLQLGQQPIGVALIGSRQQATYNVATRDRLHALLHHGAATLANAVAYAQVLQRATTDSMTGLSNHRAFKERAAEALARAERAGRPVSLLLTDIDHFKSVNDTYGHATGDVVLIAVAHALRDCLRKTDLGARYGGEEFAVLLEDTDTDAAAQLGERIRLAVQEKTFNAEGGRTLKVTLSVGVATFPQHATTVLGLVEAADRCLYAAKGNGRNQVVRADAPVVSALAS